MSALSDEIPQRPPGICGYVWGTPCQSTDLLLDGRCELHSRLVLIPEWKRDPYQRVTPDEVLKMRYRVVIGLRLAAQAIVDAA